jgi:phosphatidylinositol alpha-1,6-mannosyltransferase
MKATADTDMLARGPIMLALVTEAWGGRGGIAQYNRDFLSALAETDDPIAIDILPRLAPDATTDLPPRVTQARARPSRMGFAAEAFLTAWRTKPDIIFCGHLSMAPLCALIARSVGAKLVIQLHGIEIWTPPTDSQRRALEAADLVLCVSRYTRAMASTFAAIPPDRLRVHANTFSPIYCLGDRRAARARFGLPEEAFCILSVGRLSAQEKYKGQDRIIEALPDLQCRRSGVFYLICGEGDDRHRLEALAAEKGVAKAVRFMGYVPSDALPDLYRAADLFALPSTGEGFGIVFLEAMACGTPVLGFGVAGARDALADGALGWAPDEFNLVVTLKAAISSAQENGENLARAVEDRYGRSRFVAHAATIFDWGADRDGPADLLGDSIWALDRQRYGTRRWPLGR